MFRESVFLDVDKAKVKKASRNVQESNGRKDKLLVYGEKREREKDR